MRVKNLKSTAKIVVIIAILIMFTLGLAAQQGQREFMGKGSRNSMRMMGPGQGLDNLLKILNENQEKLKISDTQMEEIEKTLLAFEEKQVKLQNKANIQQLEMKKLMMQESKDYKKIKIALTQISDTRNDLLIIGMQARDAVKNILSAEQQEALKKIMRRKSRRPGTTMRGRRSMMGGGGNQPNQGEKPPMNPTGEM